MRSMITIESKGDFKNTEKFLNALKTREYLERIRTVLSDYGDAGCSLLANSTPVRTGETANSWSYELRFNSTSIELVWKNSRMADDGTTPLVVLIINGHGTRNGGYVVANDFVKPAISPLCQDASNAVWKVVKSL